MSTYTAHVDIFGSLFVGGERWDRSEGEFLLDQSEDLASDPWFDGVVDPDLSESPISNTLVVLWHCDQYDEFSFDYEELEGA